MKRYLLDTQAVIWLLSNSDQFPNDLREELMYSEAMFHISNLSIVEIVHLQQCGKINVPMYGKDLLAGIANMNIYTIALADEVLVQMSTLPMNRKYHSDPFDRAIIATAMSRGLTLVSSDKKFSYYEKCGLELLEI